MRKLIVSLMVSCAICRADDAAKIRFIVDSCRQAYGACVEVNRAHADYEKKLVGQVEEANQRAEKALTSGKPWISTPVALLIGAAIPMMAIVLGGKR